MTRRIVLGVFVGTLLAQLAWIVAISPFRGIDEFDHAYRAASVAHGQWFPGPRAEHGRGYLVAVPPDIVAAAHGACSVLPYTKPVNCSPVATTPGGLVQVASGAGAYNPPFYWVVGTAARGLHGDAALYAMRLTAALLCAVGIAAAAWCLLGRRGSVFLVAGLLLALTPVTMYTTALAAPNGLEMAAGIVLWCVLLTLPTELAEVSRGRSRALAVLGCGSALLLCSLRAFGPLFALLIVASVLVLRWPERGAVVRANRWTVAAATVCALVGSAENVWWTLAQRTLTGTDHGDPVTWHNYVWLPLLNALQGIAAFPTRNEPTTPVVYVLVGLAACTWWVLALVWGARRERLALLSATVVAQALPVALTWLGRADGPIWQGRYGIAYDAGVFLIAAWIVARRAPSPAPLLWIGLACVGLGQVISVAWTNRQLLHHAPGVAPDWWHPSPWLTAGLALAGMLIFAASLAGAARAARVRARAGAEAIGSSVQTQGERGLQVVT